MTDDEIVRLKAELSELAAETARLDAVNAEIASENPVYPLIRGGAIAASLFAAGAVVGALLL